MPESSPLTRAESSGYTATSLHADVMAFLAALRERRDPRLVVASFGTSPEGRDLPLVVASARGVADPAAAHALGLPIVLVLCNIHAGEVEGKEAALMLLRDLLDGLDPGLLERLTLLVVPIFNPDGNDRIDPDNRRMDLAKLEGQDGPPAGVGTRATAAGINLNRDYLRQDAPEMRLLAANVWRAWLPHLTIDCHSTNGSVHRFALTYDTPHTVESGPPGPMRFSRETLLPVITQRLRARTTLETFFYGNFVADEGLAGEGWMTYTHHPRFGSHYRGLCGRADILAECYSYLSFPERVRTTYEFLRECLRAAAERGAELVATVESVRLPPERIAVRYRLEAFPEPVEILTCEPRRPGGRPVSVRIPHLARFVGSEVVARPVGYAIPEAMVAPLERHGFAVERLAAAREVEVDAARVTGYRDAPARRILEAASLGERELLCEHRRERRRLAAGSPVVRTDVPHGAVAVYLCEARSDDGALACGFLPEPAAGEEFPILRIVRM